MNTTKTLSVGLLFIVLLYSVVHLFSTNRKISVTNEHPYEVNNGSYNNHNAKAVFVDRNTITVRASNLYELLFLNTKDESLSTIIIELILCLLTGLLLFGPDLLRVKIYKSYAIPCSLILLVCSMVLSWYVTTAFVNNMGSSYANYKYSFNLMGNFWLLVIPAVTLRTLDKFKQMYNDQTLGVS